MVDQFSFRKGNTNDAEQFKQLGLLSYGQYSKVLAPEQWNILHTNLNNNNTWADLLKTATAFVCEQDGKIIGMAFLVPNGNPTDIYEAGWCYIRMVGVDPEYAGKGIAKKLTTMCIEEAKAAKEKMITLHTSEFMDAARHIYESLGFTVLKEIAPRFGKKYWLYKLEI